MGRTYIINKGPIKVATCTLHFILYFGLSITASRPQPSCSQAGMALQGESQGHSQSYHHHLHPHTNRPIHPRLPKATCRPEVSPFTSSFTDWDSPTREVSIGKEMRCLSVVYLNATRISVRHVRMRRCASSSLTAASPLPK